MILVSAEPDFANAPRRNGPLPAPMLAPIIAWPNGLRR